MTNEEIRKKLLLHSVLAGVCAPYGTDGKFRCEKIKLLHTINRIDLENSEDE